MRVCVCVSLNLSQLSHYSTPGDPELGQGSYNGGRAPPPLLTPHTHQTFTHTRNIHKHSRSHRLCHNFQVKANIAQTDKVFHTKDAYNDVCPLIHTHIRHTTKGPGYGLHEPIPLQTYASNFELMGLFLV